MKKISVLLAVVMVLTALAAVNVTAETAELKLVYEPASVIYRPNDDVELTTVAAGSGLKFAWHIRVSTSELDHDFDLSTKKGINDFAELDPNGNMKATVSSKSRPDGTTASTLKLECLLFYDYGVFAYCSVSNSAGTKNTDVVELYPNETAPPVPKIEQLAEMDVRIGKLIKFACNVSLPDSYKYDFIEYQWYTTPDGDKDKAEAIQGEDNSVLVIDTGAGGIYFYYCRMSLVKGSSNYLYESSVAQIRIHEPDMQVSYSVTECDLDVGETAEIKANVVFENEDDKGTLSYQWKTGTGTDPVSYTPIKGETSDTITLTGADKAEKKYYCCIVTNEIEGYTFSNESSDAPVFTLHSTGEKNAVINSSPKDVYVNENETAEFTVDASNASSYEWYCVKPGGTIDDPNEPVKLGNGSEGVISGADSAVLRIKATADLNGYCFYCSVYGTGGKYVSSGNAYLTVVNLPTAEKPVIKDHPKAVSGSVGDNISIKVKAQSPDGGELKYQWFSSEKADYKSIKEIKGEKGDSLTLPTKNSGVKYYCAAVWNVKNGTENGPVYTDFAKVEIAEAETDTDAETETDAESESETVSDIETETETETETDAVTETETEAVTDTETETETETAEVSDTEIQVIETVDDTQPEDVKTDAATKPADNGEDGKDQTDPVLILLIVIISLLVLSIAGFVVLLMIKRNDNGGEPDQPGPDGPEPDETEPDEPEIYITDLDEPDEPAPEEPEPEETESEETEPDETDLDEPEPEESQPEEPQPEEPQPEEPQPEEPQPEETQPEETQPEETQPEEPEPEEIKSVFTEPEEPNVEITALDEPEPKEPVKPAEPEKKPPEVKETKKSILDFDDDDDEFLELELDLSSEDEKFD